MSDGGVTSSSSLRRGRSRLKLGLLCWAAASAIGVAVVALPDRGPRLVSLSEGHGPSLGDSLGVAVLLVGYAAFVSGLWRARSMIPAKRLLGLLAVAAAIVIVWSVGTDTGLWWVAGVAVLVGVQVGAAVAALRRLPA